MARAQQGSADPRAMGVEGKLQLSTELISNRGSVVFHERVVCVEMEQWIAGKNLTETVNAATRSNHLGIKPPMLLQVYCSAHYSRYLVEELANTNGHRPATDRYYAPIT